VKVDIYQSGIEGKLNFFGQVGRINDNTPINRAVFVVMKGPNKPEKPRRESLYRRYNSMVGVTGIFTLPV